MIKRPKKKTVRYTLTFDVPESDDRQSVIDWLSFLGRLVQKEARRRPGVAVVRIRATDGSDKP